MAVSVQIPLKATPEIGDPDCLRAGGELDTGKILYQVYVLPIQKLTYKVHLKTVLWHYSETTFSHYFIIERNLICSKSALGRGDLVTENPEGHPSQVAAVWRPIL